MPSINEMILAYEADEASALDVLRTLEREYLYVPLDVFTVANVRTELPVYITLSDDSKCVAVFSSDTVIDKKFYNKHTWKRMGYLELESYVLGLREPHNVIIDAYSEHPFMLKRDVMEQLAASRSNQTDGEAVLDTEVEAFNEAIEKVRIVFPLFRNVNRVWPLTYKTDGAPDSLCLVVDIKGAVDPERELQTIFSSIYKTLGPSVPFLLLSYAEVKNEIRELKAEPCYSRPGESSGK